MKQERNNRKVWETRFKNKVILALILILKTYMYRIPHNIRSLFIFMFIEKTDNMKQPGAILVLQYWYTILVIPVFYQYLPVSAILVQILVKLVSQYLPEFSSICNTRRYWSLPKYEYCRYRGFWEILVIPVLQILEDSGKYW